MKKITLVLLSILATPGCASALSTSYDKNLKMCEAQMAEPVSPYSNNQLETQYATREDTITPWKLTGATTVSSAVANCMIKAMGDSLVIVSVMNEDLGIKGSYALPDFGPGRDLSDEESRQMGQVYAALTDQKQDRPLLVYCYGKSCFNSYHAIVHLKRMGYRNLLWMREGLAQWLTNDYPVESIGLNAYVKSGYRVSPIFPATMARCPASQRAGIQHFIDRFSVMIVTSANTPRATDYYRRKLSEISCVDLGKDSDAMVSAKISTSWREHRAFEARNPNAFVEKRLNLIKIAVDHHYDTFIRDALAWGVDVNYVDSLDGLTVLDYVQRRLKASRDKADKNKLLGYYQLLKETGAKHQSEL